MADPKTNACEADDAAEKAFRKKNEWHSFTTAAYGALGMASFFGALSVLANGLIGLAAKKAAVQGLGMMEGMAGIVTNVAPMAVIGGLVAAGLAFTYMAQREATELRCLQDEHLAQQNAKEMGHGKAPQVEMQQNQPEYPDQCRKDGKTWDEYLALRDVPAAGRALQ